MNFEIKTVNYVNETSLGKLSEEDILEKSIVNPADKKRMFKLIKDYGKIVYNGKEYKAAVVSGTGKFIKAQGIEIKSDKIKSYQIDFKRNVVVLDK